MENNGNRYLNQSFQGLSTNFNLFPAQPCKANLKRQILKMHYKEYSVYFSKTFRKYLKSPIAKNQEIESQRRAFLQIYYMTNKRAQFGKQCEQKLSKICQKAYENQLNLQTFYRTNHLQFPPLFRSKNLIYPSTNRPKLQPSIIILDKFQKSEQKPGQKSDAQKQTPGKSKPNICPIIFKRVKARKGSFIVHATKNNFHVSRTIEIDKDINKSKPKNSEKMNLRFINQAQKSSLSTILNSFYPSRSKLGYSQRGSYQQDKNTQNSDGWKSQLNESILVNTAVTANPQNLFLQSIRSRTNLLNAERQLIVKRQTKLDFNKINVYRHANGLLRSKKKKIEIKEFNHFEPWQMVNPEEENIETELPHLPTQRL